MQYRLESKVLLGLGFNRQPHLTLSRIQPSHNVGQHKQS